MITNANIDEILCGAAAVGDAASVAEVLADGADPQARVVVGGKEMTAADLADKQGYTNIARMIRARIGQLVEGGAVVSKRLRIRRPCRWCQRSTAARHSVPWRAVACSGRLRRCNL